jgi:hypothetical protein
VHVANRTPIRSTITPLKWRTECAHAEVARTEQSAALGRADARTDNPSSEKAWKYSTLILTSDPAHAWHLIRTSRSGIPPDTRITLDARAISSRIVRARVLSAF